MLSMLDAGVLHKYFCTGDIFACCVAIAYCLLASLFVCFVCLCVCLCVCECIMCMRVMFFDVHLVGSFFHDFV